MKKPKRVTVYWEDAWGSSKAVWDEEDRKETLETWPMEATGYLMYKDKKVVVLAFERSGKGSHWRSTQTIPRANVKRIEHLISYNSEE